MLLVLCVFLCNVVNALTLRWLREGHPADINSALTISVGGDWLERLL